MKILSIDIGLKSFTGVLLQGTDIIHQQTNDLSVNGKDLPNVIQTLYTICIKLSEYNPDVVLVEKQLGKFSFAQLESAVYMFFINRNTPIKQINPRNKLKVHIENVLIDKEFKKKYDANKYQAKQMLDAFLNNTNQNIQVDPRYKKDVADAVLQALWYINASEEQS